MKLLLCHICFDVRKLKVLEKTRCQCGYSFGWYESDRHHAVVGGEAFVIGIANSDVREAMRRADHNTIRCWMMNDNPRVRRAKIGEVPQNK